MLLASSFCLMHNLFNMRFSKKSFDTHTICVPLVQIDSLRNLIIVFHLQNTTNIPMATLFVSAREMPDGSINLSPYTNGRLLVCMTTIWTKISTDEASLRIDFSRIEPHTKFNGGSFWFITKSCSNRYIRSDRLILMILLIKHVCEYVRTWVRACVYECIGSMSKLILNCKNPICTVG